MHGLNLAYNILSVCGFWTPSHCLKNEKLKFFYRVYSIFIIVCIYGLVSLQALLLFTSEFDFQIWVDILLTFLLSISFCMKGVIILLRRNKVNKLREMLRMKLCLPSEIEEFKSQEKVDNFNRKLTIFWIILGKITLIIFFMAPFLQDLEDRKLPYRIWIPLDLRNESNFLKILLVEFCIFLFASAMNATASNLIIGYVSQASNQFNFIKYRIQRLCHVVENDNRYKVDRNITQQYEMEILKNCVEHHNYIFAFSKLLMESFNLVLIQLYLGSVLILAVTVYEFTYGDSSAMHKIKTGAFLFCMMSEIFIYCWYGNELALKSSEFGYNDQKTNWLVLSEESKKMLKLMALRSKHPIVISFHGIINFNLGSFKSIMKVTYSAFNVMKKNS